MVELLPETIKWLASISTLSSEKEGKKCLKDMEYLSPRPSPPRVNLICAFTLPSLWVLNNKALREKKLETDKTNVNLGRRFANKHSRCFCSVQTVLCSIGCTRVVWLSYLSCRAEQNGTPTETKHEFIFCKSRAETWKLWKNLVSNSLCRQHVSL